jgi:hypothetical protein
LEKIIEVVGSRMAAPFQTLCRDCIKRQAPFE